MPQNSLDTDKIREGNGVKIIGIIEVGRPSLLSVFTEATKSICDYFNIPYKKDSLIYTFLLGGSKEIYRYPTMELYKLMWGGACREVSEEYFIELYNGNIFVGDTEPLWDVFEDKTPNYNTGE